MAIPGFNQPFSSYAPHPSGGTMFSGAGGNTLLAGPAADDLKRQIDASAGPDMRQANNGSGFFGSPSPAMPGASAPSGGNAAGGMGSGGMGPPPSPAAPNPAAGVEMSTSPAAASPVPTRGIQGQAAAPAPSGEIAGPHKTINPSELIERVHSNPHWQDTSRKVTTTGAADPRIAGAMLHAYDTKMQADAATAEAQKLVEARNYQLANVQAVNAAKEADALKDKEAAQLAAQTQAAKEFDRLSQAAQENLNNASNREVDTNRLFRGRPGAQIGAAISAALGAFGSSLTHTPNFALDIINRSIDNDIQAQREQIQRGVGAAQNDLVRIRDKYNVSNSTAEKLYSIFSTQRAQAMVRQNAALLGGQDAMARAATIDQTLADKNVATLEKIKQELYGNATETAEAKFYAGGDSFRVRPEIKATAEAAKYVGETGKAMGEAEAGTRQAEHGGLTAGEEAKLAANGKGGKLPARLAGMEAVQDAFLGDIATYSKHDPGGYIMPHSEGGGLFQTKARTELNARADAIAGKAAQATAGAISQAELDHFREGLRSPYEGIRNATAKALQEAVVSTRAAVENQRGGAATGIEPGEGSEAP